MALHLVEIRLDAGALVRFLEMQGLNGRADEDGGYGIHAWLTAAFGELALRPWRLLWQRGRPPRLLGYSPQPASKLREHMAEFADPGVAAVCSRPEDIVSRNMPTFRVGRELGMDVQCMPVIRKSRTGIEMDIFLSEEGHSKRRDVVYCEWARDRLMRSGAVDDVHLSLEGFRLVKQLRRTNTTDGYRSARTLIRPQAQIQGRFAVKDAEAFDGLLTRGLGRHVAFGYGMVLLRPPS